MSSEVENMFDNAVRVAMRKGATIQEALYAAAEVLHDDGVAQGRKEAQSVAEHTLTPEYGLAWADKGADDVRTFNNGVSRDAALALAEERSEGIAPTLTFQRWVSEWKAIG